MARRCRQDFGGVAGQERCDGQAEAGEDAAESGSEQRFSTIRRGQAGEKLKSEDRGQNSERGGEAQSTLLAGRGVRALENRTGPSTLSIGAGLIRRTPGIAVSKAFFAFPASVCNGWACLSGFGTGTRMAPKKKLRALRVTCRERAALLRPRLPRRAVLARTRGTRMWGHWYLCRRGEGPCDLGARKCFNQDR